MSDQDKTQEELEKTREKVKSTTVAAARRYRALAEGEPDVCTSEILVFAAIVISMVALHHDKCPGEVLQDSISTLKEFEEDVMPILTSANG